MSVPPHPPVDPRTVADLAADTRRAIARSLGLPQPVGSQDAKIPGDGLVSIFARLAEIVVQRVNAVPEKNFVAFLDLVGVRLHPPQPARVPLTFHLAPGTDGPAPLPARTLVAAVPGPEEAEPPVFETEREVVLTSASIVAAYTRDPWFDRYTDQTAIASGAEAGSFPAFEGADPIAHELYLGDDLFALPAAKEITFWFRRAVLNSSWPLVVEWSRLDGDEWQPLTATVVQDGTDWRVTLPGVTGIDPSEVDGRTGSWVRGRLTTSLPSPAAAPDAVGQTLAPDAAFAGPEPLDADGPLAPFGEDVPRTTFALACGRAFSKPRAQIVLDVDLDSDRPPGPSSDLELLWEYSRADGWGVIGGSAPADTGADPSFSFEDNTYALTQDGQVRFQAPPDWAEGEVEGVTGRWLRVRVGTGDYGDPPGRQPPFVRRLAVSYTWPLPRIEAVRSSVWVARSGLPPDLGFVNEAPLELSKDFLPFGAVPKFGDTFYVASDEALALPGAKVTVVVTPTANLQAPREKLPTLQWEYWSSKSGLWQRLDVADDTAVLTKSTEATLRLTVPSDLAPVEVNGELRRWLRARIVAGDYGDEARYDPVDANDLSKGFKLVPATLRPPSLARISFAFDYRSPQRPPRSVVTVNDFVTETRTGSFLPFRPSADVRPTLYVAADRDFGGQPTAIYFGVADAPYRSGAHEGDSTEPAAVVWEYRKEDEWVRLTVLDETRGLTRRGLLIFLAPEDFAPVRLFDRTAHWLRVRWERGNYQTPPQLGRVLTNTTWASHAVTVENDVLGSGTGERNQRVRVTQVPVLPGQRIEVAEPDVPSAPELAAIRAEEGPDAVSLVAPVEGGEPEVWVRWHEVVDFATSAPRSRHYVVDRLTGVIQFGDGLHGASPPEGRGNIVATLYRSGGGAVGNRPVGTITELKSAVPYVDVVANVEPASGGADAEPLALARERGPRMLRHGDRAVAAADFEDLAFEASPAVARVSAVPAGSAADAGRVGLVVVPDSDEPRPVPSLELLTRVKDYVEARLSPAADLWVRGPGWLLVAVTTEVVPERFEAAAEVESAVRDRLARFLHPLTGGTDGAGWPFGRAPHRSDVLAVVERVPGVDHVRSLLVDETVVEPGPVSETVLTYSGDHTVKAVAEPDGSAA